jgi:hypothetical protein
MKDKLTMLENRLRELIEIRMVNVLFGLQAEHMIVQQLAAAIQPPEGEADEKPRPNVYTLLAHPETIARWQATPAFSETLLEILKAVAGEANVHFASPPEITLAADESLETDTVRVVASYRVETLGETKGVADEASREEGDVESSTNLPENAFLIVDSVKVFPLNKSVINIGRRLGNHLVINDPRVSRNHAQLRAIKGRFVLFDLDSTGGTYVNGQRVNQSVLYPGDVISLAGVPLIFGQDNPIPRPDLVDTAPLSPESGDRPTAILRNDTEKNNKK